MSYTGIKKKGFYRTGEIAKIVNLSNTTVIRYVRALKLPRHKLSSGQYRYPHSTLESLAQYMGITLTENENGFIQN